MSRELVAEEVLHLTFLNEEKKKVTFRLTHPKKDLTSQEILDSMQMIIDLNAFTSSGGDLKSPVSAKVVETITDEYDISVN